MELNAVRIFVRDLQTAKQFYEQRLALTLKVDGSAYGYCVFKSGGADLIVELVAEDAPEDEQILVGRFTGLSFTVTNAEETHRGLLAQGVTFTGPPERQFWGGTLATFQDPSGNELQICQLPDAA